MFTYWMWQSFMSLGSSNVLSTRVDAASYEMIEHLVCEWTEEAESRYICVANVHMIMECLDSSDYRDIVNGADLVTPDGMPLVWTLRLQGFKRQERVYGPDLTLRLCALAERRAIPVGLYGGTEESLNDFIHFLRRRFPRMIIATRIAPPFRSLTHEEDELYVSQLRESGVRLLFVGTGCPRQERWMAEHSTLIPAVMVGVGAAFDFHSGRVKQAPAWVQRIGMEWFFRLLMEPKRLWKRYFKHNPRFVFYVILQLLGRNWFREV